MNALIGIVSTKTAAPIIIGSRLRKGAAGYPRGAGKFVGDVISTVKRLPSTDVDTATPMGSVLFTIMAALGQMEHEIKRERVVDSIAKRREAGKDLGGRPQRIADSQIRNARRLIDARETATTVSRVLGMSRATFYRRTRALELAAESSEPL